MVYRVEIAGGIAVGKTTLSDALRSRGYPVISEKLEENPFLTRAYADKGSRGFDVGMSFLMSKACGIETYAGNCPIVFVDYAMIAEYAYNDVHLRSVDARAHAQVEQAIHYRRQKVGDPQMLIHLICPAQHQLQNIRTRNRDFEQGHSAEYLKAINDGIMNWSNNEIRSSCRKVMVNTAMADVQHPVFIDNLVRMIHQEMSGLTNQPAPRP